MRLVRFITGIWAGKGEDPPLPRREESLLRHLPDLPYVTIEMSSEMSSYAASSPERTPRDAEGEQRILLHCTPHRAYRFPLWTCPVMLGIDMGLWGAQKIFKTSVTWGFRIGEHITRIPPQAYPIIFVGGLCMVGYALGIPHRIEQPPPDSALHPLIYSTDVCNALSNETPTM